MNLWNGDTASDLTLDSVRFLNHNRPSDINENNSPAHLPLDDGLPHVKY